MALQLRRRTMLNCFPNCISTSTSMAFPPLYSSIRCKTIQNLPCSIQPHSNYFQGGRLIANTSYNSSYSSTFRVPIIMHSNMQVKNLLLEKNYINSRNHSTYYSKACELKETKSFSTNECKEVPLEDKSKEISGGATSEGTYTPKLRHKEKKKKKSTVSKSIHGNIANEHKVTEEGSIIKQASKSKECVQDASGKYDSISEASTNPELKTDNLRQEGSAAINYEASIINKLKYENSKQEESVANNESAKSNKSAQRHKLPAKKPFRPLYPPSGKSVMIVESVTKAKVIQNLLGDMYEVLPSHGHLRDLAGRSGSVRPDEDFSMVWEVPSSAWTHLKSIKVALNGAENLILASDPDREGEANAWHIIEMLKQQDALSKHVTVARVVFHEITESSIKSALQVPRELDTKLVDAHLARRALDYLIGFNISPVLWRKLPGCSSAGRVQSAALALICDREMEIEKFNKKEYWTVGVEFNTTTLEEKCPISSRLTHFNSKKLDPQSIRCEDEAQEIKNMITASDFKVIATKKSKTVKNPPMPFTTSTLQQDAANKFHFTSSYTMKLAQKLYEGIQLSDGEATGLITYMRTDGTHISTEAAENINSFIKERFGEKFASKILRKQVKKVKNAQEAHEAIRPTDIRRLPEALVDTLDDDSLKLYKLIWTRTIACQMEPATGDMVQVDIGNLEGSISFRTEASKSTFLGFQEVYKDMNVDIVGSEDEEKVNDIAFTTLLNLKVRKSLAIIRVDLERQHTKPPPQYSEGALIKQLDELGIGRASTYASIMKVLQDRDYVRVKDRVLHPEFRGRMVSAFLKHHFNEVANYSFTAKVENELDNVSAGVTEWKGLMKDYWSRFSKFCSLASKAEVHQVERMLEKTFGHYLFSRIESDSRVCPSCSVGTLRFKISKLGSGYLIGCDEYPKCKHIALTLYCEEDDEDVPSEGSDKSSPKYLGNSPKTNEKIFLKSGPYGHYVQLGEDRKGYTPKRASIGDVKDIDSFTLEDAVELLKYPITLGNHPVDNRPVILSLAKHGFTVKHRMTFAPVPRNMNPKKVTLEIGMKLLSGKKATQRGRPKSKPKNEDDLLG